MKRLIALVSAVACVMSVSVSSLLVSAATVTDTAKDSGVGYNAQTVKITGTSSDPYTVTIAGEIVTVKPNATVQEAVKSIAEDLSTQLDMNTYHVHAYFTGAAADLYKYGNAGFNGVTVSARSSGTAIAPAISSNPAIAPVSGGATYALSAILDQTALVAKDDRNGSDGVKPGSTVYFKVANAFADLSDFDFIVKKGENAKQVASVKAVEKKFTDALVKVADGTNVSTTVGRGTYIAVKLNDNFTTNEYKVSFDMQVKAKRAANGFTKGQASPKWENLGTTWVSNESVSGDQSFGAGKGGVVVKPEKNAENEIVWENNNHEIARLKFHADSDAKAFFPKLSTKWIDAKYTDAIGNADAFGLTFVGNPTISSTSRPVLEIYNPYRNSDDEYDIPVEDLRIYEVDADGNVTEITKTAKFGVNDDGDEVITIRTRVLGEYIITDGSALLDDGKIGNLNPEDEALEPNINKKPVPNTGR